MAEQMSMRLSTPMVAGIVGKGLSGYPIATIDVLRSTGAAEHLGAIIVYGVSKQEAQTRAAFIVRAVNAHDALVEALRNMADRFIACAVHSGTDKEFAEAACSEARAALKLAEGKEDIASG